MAVQPLTADPQIDGGGPDGGDDAAVRAGKLKTVLLRLDAEAQRRVGLRQAVEERWLSDIRQYHGKYPRDVSEALRQSGMSSLFVNMTRPKTNMLSARLFDMLFPADDKNWGIGPTPVPEMAVEAEQAVERARKAQDDVAAAEEAGDAEAAAAAAQEQTQLEEQAERLNAVMDEARARADAMEREMHDQLVECRYPAEARDVIEDGCKIGFGCLRGPIAGARTKERWTTVQSQNGVAMSVLEREADPAPAYWRADPWSVFVDPDARTVEDCEGIFFRHLLNKKQVRKLAMLDAFDRDALRRVLKTAPTQGLPGNMAALRDILGDTSNAGERYHVWEYEGPLDPEDMATLADAMGDEATMREAAEVDPLSEMHAVVWWCNNELIRFDLHPMDSGEPRLSVFSVEKDEATLHGYGVPAIMRDVQSWLSSSVRMCQDNGQAAAGPQVIVNKQAIEPEDGDWRPRAWKIWNANVSGYGASGQIPPFQFVQADANLNQIIPLIELALRFIDDMTGMPRELMGEPGSTPQQTATGTALRMTSANVIFRRIVKNFDDDVTVPAIRRLYHFNMQFSPKEHIKGDYKVKARGSSVLAERVFQSQNLMALLQAFGPDDPDVKADEHKREIYRSLNVDDERFIRTPAEREEFVARQAEANAAQMAELEVKNRELEVRERDIEARIEVANMDNDRHLRVAQMNQETTMMETAERLNITIEQLQAKLQDAREARRSKERIVMAEATMAERTGQHGGGYV